MLYRFATVALVVSSLLAGRVFSAEKAEARFPSDAHIAVVYYTGSMILQGVPGAKACVQPPTTPTKLSIKAVSTSSPLHPDGYNFLFWQDNRSKKWIYGGEIQSLQTIRQDLNLRINELEAGKAPRTLFSLGLLHVPNDVRILKGMSGQLLEILKQLEIKNNREVAPANNGLKTLQDYMPISDLWFSPSKAEGPPISIHSVSLFGVIDTEDLKQCPFTAAPFLPKYFTDSSQLFPVSDIEQAEAWIAGYCAANNHTIAGRTGKEVFGVAFLGRYVTSSEKGFNLHYYVAYSCLDKSNSGSVDKFKYGVAPEFDLGLNSLNPASADSRKRAQDTKADRQMVGTGAAGTEPKSTPPPTLSDRLFERFDPTLPSLSYDKTTGFEQSISFTFHPTTADAGTDTGPPPVTIPFGGMNSFQKDYYSVTAGPKIPFNKYESLSVTFDRSALPKGGVTQTTTDGKLAFAATAPSDTSTFTYNVTLACSAITTPQGTAASSQNTDEYSSTGFVQKLFYLGDGMSQLKTKEKNQPQPSFDPGKLGPNGEIDLNAWVKPTESTQKSNFYADILSRAHLGVDVPTPDFFPGPIEFLRLDFSLTGGGIIGVSPTYDRFNAGSNINESITTPEVPTQPTVRSLGSNSANVYNAASKTSGAISYGDLSFTMAIPVPYLSWSVYHKRTEGSSNGNVTAAGLSNVSEQNNLDYVSYYADILSLKPLLACDAAYLGAPAGFADRSLVSLGVGAELSLGPLNVDLLYAKTYLDTSTQTKSANLTVQATYDVHF